MQSISSNPTKSVTNQSANEPISNAIQSTVIQQASKPTKKKNLTIL